MKYAIELLKEKRDRLDESIAGWQHCMRTLKRAAPERVQEIDDHCQELWAKWYDMDRAIKALEAMTPVEVPWGFVKGVRGK